MNDIFFKYIILGFQFSLQKLKYACLIPYDFHYFNVKSVHNHIIILLYVTCHPSLADLKIFYLSLTFSTLTISVYHSWGLLSYLELMFSTKFGEFLNLGYYFF